MVRRLVREVVFVVDGDPHLMALELIDPAPCFPLAPHAADRLAGLLVSG